MTNDALTQEARRRTYFALALTTVLAPVFGWLYAGAWGAVAALAAWLIFVVLPRATGHRPFGFLYRGFFTERCLPMTMINITLAIIVGSLQFGMDFAFYAALAGVPIVVLMLVIVALEPDAETPPEAIAVRVDGHSSRKR